MKCEHRKTDWIYVDKQARLEICLTCYREINPDKVMIIGFGIIKKDDIETIDILPK